MTKKRLFITIIECMLMVAITIGLIFYCRETHFVLPKGVVLIWTPWAVIPVDRTCFIIVISPIVLTCLGYLYAYISDAVEKFREK